MDYLALKMVLIGFPETSVISNKLCLTFQKINLLGLLDS
jgi:hypothetical protein